jgi:hypothetical protein
MKDQKDIKPEVMGAILVLLAVVECFISLVVGYELKTDLTVWERLTMPILMAVLSFYPLAGIAHLLEAESLEDWFLVIPFLGLYIFPWIGAAYLFTIHIVYGFALSMFMIIGTYLLWDATKTAPSPMSSSRELRPANPKE